MAAKIVLVFMVVVGVYLTIKEKRGEL